jgi:acetyl-CoA acetyltransferase
LAQERLRNKVAIVGAAVTNVERRSEIPLGAKGVEVSDAALADAGLTRSDIDAVACGAGLPADNVNQSRLNGIDLVNSQFLIEQMELKPVWWYDNGSFPPAFAEAVMAIASGAADYALVNRSVHNPAGRYHTYTGLEASGLAQWTAPYGFVGWVSGMAMAYKEYQERYGARREHMATFVLQNRKIVQDIPEAYWYGKELTFEEYMSARMISEPLCLFDNDIPVDASGSFVLTSAERAKDLPNKPVYITAWSRIRNREPWLPGTLGELDEYYDGGFDLAKRVWANSGWKPSDIDVVQLYDGFAMETWFWLEVLGFCPQGEAWQFIQDGHIAPDGPFPLNTGGGSQGWGRLHGIVQIYETYLQMSGRAGARQLARTETGLSTYGDPAHEVGEALLYSTDPSA